MAIFAPPPKPAESLTFNFNKAQVLLIDSNPTSMSVLSQILTGFGFRKFVRCADISKLEAIVRTQTVDLILVDPFGFGQPIYDWIFWLRHEQLGANSAALTLIVTAHACLEEVRAAKDCGADYVVAKPFSPGVLLDRILWAARHDNRGGFMAEHQALVSTQGSGVELW